MKITSLSNTMRLFVCTVIAGGSLFAAAPAVEPCPSTTQSQDWNFPVEASQLLEDIRSTASSLARDADTLASYPLTGLSTKTHSARLTLVKEHINTIGDNLERLQEIRHVTAPWQQLAIDSILPHAVDLAEHTQAAILHLRENPKYLWAPEYRDRLQAIWEGADRLKESVDLHLDLASTQERLEELRMKTVLLGS